MLTMASQHQNAVLDSEQERPMLEGALTFLVILTSLRIHLGTFLLTTQVLGNTTATEVSTEL